MTRAKTINAPNKLPRAAPDIARLPNPFLNRECPSYTAGRLLDSPGIYSIVADILPIYWVVETSAI